MVLRVKQLREAGKTLSESSELLSLPSATVDRIVNIIA